MSLMSLRLIRSLKSCIIIGITPILIHKHSYWCVLRREFSGMIQPSSLVIIIPATPSNLSIPIQQPYVKRTSKLLNPSTKPFFSGMIHWLTINFTIPATHPATHLATPSIPKKVVRLAGALGALMAPSCSSRACAATCCAMSPWSLRGNAANGSWSTWKILRLGQLLGGLVIIVYIINRY